MVDKMEKSNNNEEKSVSHPNLEHLIIPIIIVIVALLVVGFLFYVIINNNLPDKVEISDSEAKIATLDVNNYIKNVNTSVVFYYGCYNTATKQYVNTSFISRLNFLNTPYILIPAYNGELFCGLIGYGEYNENETQER